MANLTPKQKAFADEYIINGGNATQAAIKAGYSKKTARSMGKENLTKPHILEYIHQRMNPIEKKRKISADDALDELIAIWQGEMQTSVSKHINRLKRNKVEKDMQYEFTPDLENKIKALDLYLKYKSLFAKAQLEKMQSEADILRDKANKLSEDVHQNELLDALVNLPVEESEIDADSI